jgi:hypothetical protein
VGQVTSICMCFSSPLANTTGLFYFPLPLAAAACRSSTLRIHDFASISPSESSRRHRASAARVSGTERQGAERTGMVHGGLAGPAEGGAVEAELPCSQGVGRRQAGSTAAAGGGLAIDGCTRACCSARAGRRRDGHRPNRSQAQRGRPGTARQARLREAVGSRQGPRPHPGDRDKQ